MIATITICIILIVFSLIYQKNSSLSQDDKGIRIQVHSKKVLLESKQIKMTPISLANVNIIQSKLSDGSYFEVAKCEATYTFNQDTKEIIETLFEAKKVEVVFSIKKLLAIRVTLQNTQVMNLFVDENDMKELKFFYGISYEKFVETINYLSPTSTKDFTVSGLFEPVSPMSQWNILNNDCSAKVVLVDYA